MLRIIRTTIALSALFLTILLNGQGKHVVPVQETLQQSHATVKPVKSHHHEATLTDASHLYRICSSRPQRISPTQGTKTQRTGKQFGCFALRRIVKPLYTFHDGRRRLETAPFCLSASRDYYVIALRHIIR